MNNLNPKQDSFCVHFTTIGADTFSNGTRSAIASGYSKKSVHVQANKLLQKDEIWERIRELTTEHMALNNITVDKVLADLEHDKLLAREAAQYGVAKSCTELQGKFLAMFTERHDVKQTQVASIEFIDGTRTIEEVELELVRRMNKLGTAEYYG